MQVPELLKRLARLKEQGPTAEGSFMKPVEASIPAVAGVGEQPAAVVEPPAEVVIAGGVLLPCPRARGSPTGSRGCGSGPEPAAKAGEGEPVDPAPVEAVRIEDPQPSSSRA